MELLIMPTTFKDVQQSLDAVKATFHAMIMDIFTTKPEIETIRIETSPSNHDDGDYSSRSVISVSANGEYIYGDNYDDDDYDEDEDETDDICKPEVPLLGEDSELLNKLYKSEYRWADLVNYPDFPKRADYENYRDYEKRADVIVYQAQREIDYKAYLDTWYKENADIAWLASLYALGDIDGELLPVLLPKVDGTLTYNRDGSYTFSEYDYY